MYEWAKEMNCAVTVCDTKGIILYMNDKACQTFAKYGNLIGKNLLTCHNAQSQEKIHEMLRVLKKMLSLLEVHLFPDIVRHFSGEFH